MQQEGSKAFEALVKDGAGRAEEAPAGRRGNAEPRPRPGWPGFASEFGTKASGWMGQARDPSSRTAWRARSKARRALGARDGGAEGAGRGARSPGQAQGAAPSARPRATQDGRAPSGRSRGKAFAAAQAAAATPELPRPRSAAAARRSAAMPRGPALALEWLPGDKPGATSSWPRKRRAALHNASSKPHWTCSTASASRTSRPRWWRRAQHRPRQPLLPLPRQGRADQPALQGLRDRGCRNCCTRAKA